MGRLNPTWAIVIFSFSVRASKKEDKQGTMKPDYVELLQHMKYRIPPPEERSIYLYGCFLVSG